MHSALHVFSHPEIGQWLFYVGILFFLLSGPMLVFGHLRMFVPMFTAGLALVVNASLLLYADEIGSWMNKVTWTDLLTSTGVWDACGSGTILLLSLVVLNFTSRGKR